MNIIIIEMFTATLVRGNFGEIITILNIKINVDKIKFVKWFFLFIAMPLIKTLEGNILVSEEYLPNS